MAVLFDVGRISVPRRIRSDCQKPRRRVVRLVFAQQRATRVATPPTEPTSQFAKTGGTWPESISNFFQIQRAAIRSAGNGGNANPPPTKRFSDDDDSGRDADDEPATLLTLAQAESLASQKGIRLPIDFVKAAKTTGLRSTTLLKYLSLQSLAWVGTLVRSFPWVRDRLIADEAYLFKVFTEVIIDSGCATLAEVRKRGAEFFDEFEFYLSDMIVGLVLDVALVSLLAPVAVVGAKPPAASMKGWQRYIGRLPSALFEANIKGVREYSLSQRLVSFLYKGGQYAVIGFACGLMGQGMANSMMLLRRHLAGGATEADVAVPPLLKSALVWALFMGVSSNTRYQIVVGLERLVDMSVAKRLPQIAYFTTIVIRFVNNVIGGENFIDMARWAGIQ